MGPTMDNTDTAFTLESPRVERLRPRNLEQRPDLSWSRSNSLLQRRAEVKEATMIITLKPGFIAYIMPVSLKG